jgi:hypothetical protein
MINKADMLEANAIEIAAWTEAFGQIADPDSSAAAAIHKHIDALVNRERIMELPEDEIAKIRLEAVDREIEQSADATWRAIEADLPREKVSEIKRYIDDLRHR